MRKRRSPCTSTLLVPSGIRSMRVMEHWVPNRVDVLRQWIEHVLGALGHDEDRVVRLHRFFDGAQRSVTINEERHHHTGE